MKQNWEKEFDKIFPCIQEGCSNDGIIPEQDGEGDWQPAQCEYCYKVRFPVKDFISKLIQQVKQEKDKEYADFSERMNKALFEAEEQVKQEERERILKEVKK